MIALQHRRLRSQEPEDEVFVFRWWADLQFLIVALRRLRRSAEIVARIPRVSGIVNSAIQEFDGALPCLSKMRNVGEHIDSYAVDAPSRHDKSVSCQQLQVGTWDGTVYCWLGESLDIDVALDVSQRLFGEIKKCIVSPAKNPAPARQSKSSGKPTDSR
jgi:hypothetical protein